MSSEISHSSQNSSKVQPSRIMMVVIMVISTFILIYFFKFRIAYSLEQIETDLSLCTGV